MKTPPPVLAQTPEPPYYAVVFTAVRAQDMTGYADMAAEMRVRARAIPGFLGLESSADAETGITVSYWRDLEAIKNWKDDLRHQEAQKMGRQKWYDAFHIRVAKVERAYGFVR